MNPSDLHTFFVYVFFGYLFIFPLVLLCLKLCRMQDPKQRMSLYLLALAAPFAGFALYHTVLAKRCQAAGSFYAGSFWSIFDYWCWLGSNALRFLGPVVVLMMFAGLFKAVAVKFYIQRLQVKTANPEAEEANRVREMVGQRCREWGLRVPKVIFSETTRFSSFVTGLFRPVMVISLPLIRQMTDSELQAILTHELIHIRRGDTIKGWFLHLLKDLMFFSPFSVNLLERYLLERERLCDQEAVNELGSTHGYVAALLKTWRLLLESRSFPAGAMVEFSGKKRDMEQRIISLLAPEKQKSALSTGSFYAVMITVATLTVIFLGMIC